MIYTPAWDLTTIPDAPLYSELGRRRAIAGGGRRKTLRPCPDCGAMLGAREMRRHPPKCPARSPILRGSRKKAIPGVDAESKSPRQRTIEVELRYTGRGKPLPFDPD